MEKYNEQMLSHPFFTEVFSDSGSVISRILDPQLNSSTRSEQEWYFSSVFFYLSNFCGSFVRLEHTRAFLGHLRLLKQYRETGITRSTYIEYHRSNHAVTLVGIFDIALILTSKVFRLGLPERQCRSEIITQNSWVRSREVDRILQELNSAVEPLREPRNLFIHRGILQVDEFLTALGAYDLLEGKGMVGKGGPLETIDRSKTEFAYEQKLSVILDELRRQEEPVFNTSMSLLTRLHLVYKDWKQKIA
jgi:hypothetical protein